ncbi:MAG: Asp-tRNA(Asn)/Glu-tRNA(Gln) amidotransferase subunit GatB [Clostridiales bacterium]|nr:Asp-tRNA(Asn)/Glu-tRNA(Gln) amidotransferase subunit GatB [Clostridiales bacterium]
MNWETVIGLEVHVELATKSKIFCSCTTEFGGAPNTHVCPVCSGLPGVLPTLNKSVVEFAVKTGLATNCEITRYNKFDRKNYFYPDLPKAYQVSQLYLPICRNGHVDIEVNGIKKSIGIHEIHMEEDAGKLVHDPWEDSTLVDYNRCGVPLLEIVSEPDFRSGDEVIAYLEKLRDTLIYLGVSDCKMQEGSMRADVNLSVRPEGQKEFGTRTEMKNINSFKAISRAIVYEAKRQIEQIEMGKRVIQETRRWDENKDATYAMRSKENAQDYRYFPEPDLLPIEISEEWIEKAKKEMPELADAKRVRYVKELGLTEYDAKVLTAEHDLAILFEEAAAVCGQPKEVCNLITGELMRLITEAQTTADKISIDPKKMADIISLTVSGKINRNAEKEVFEALFKENIDPEAYIKEKGLMMLNDDSLVSDTIDEVIKNNPKSIEDYKGGKKKAFGFLVGQTMRALKGKANPQAVNKILREKLNSL